MSNQNPVTRGAHHIGLTVSRLEETANFFIKILGWSEVRRDPSYPSIFVSDGNLMITLWEVKSDSPNKFNRKENVGLHHLALSVDSFDELYSTHERLIQHGIEVEFSPEFLRDGPAKHMMCYEPSGIRIEFICIPEK